MLSDELSKNVIIIDSVFLNRVVKETLEFYQKSKPEKEFTPYTSVSWCILLLIMQK